MVDRIRQLSIWSVAVALISALVLLPVAAIFWLALSPSENIWPHLLATVLPRYLSNSLILMVAVGAIAAVIGTTTAWLVVAFEFRGRRWLELALLLPLAVPAYIAAYALADLMDYAGPVQSALRGVFGWSSSKDYFFPHFRSRFGAVLVLSMAFYPYVYILARAAFRDQSASTLVVARVLGNGPWALFRRVALPMARPAIWAGTAIVMMEVLGDFGAVDYFSVQTLTTGVFSVWTQTNNPNGAAQIAGLILLMILVLVALEKSARKKQRFHTIGKHLHPAARAVLAGWRGSLAPLLCAVPILLGFVLPVSVLLSHAIGQDWFNSSLWVAVWHTLSLATTTALVTVFAGLVLVYGLRQMRSRWQVLLPVTALGYAAPGAVLALGILVPFAAFDTALADWIEAGFGRNIGLLLTGSTAALIFAYCVRFFAVAQNSLDAALGRVSPGMDMAARALGQNAAGTLLRVHLPMIRGSVLVAALLIFVDAAKELPATLMLRPFNFETLATLTYYQATLEDIAGAAPSALIVTLVGILPVLLLARATNAGWQAE